MLILNGSKFALNENEFKNSLFESGGTCIGYYRPNKKTITLLDHNKKKIGVITHYGVLACATKQDNGKWWYSHATIDQIGQYTSYKQQIEEINKALIDNGITITY